MARMLSAQFREQARADLALAQMVSRADQSGHALGEAMFLAQQCFEKQLKAIVLLIHESMGIEPDAGLLQGLSHAFFPRLRKFHERRVETIRLPRRLGALANIFVPTFGDHARYVRHASAFWKKYADLDEPWAMRLWKNSMGVNLPPEELDLLNDLFYRDLVALTEVLRNAGSAALPTRQFHNVFDPYPDMLAAVRDELLLKSLHANHMCDAGNVFKVGAVYTQTSRQHAVFSTALELAGKLPACQRDLALKRLVAEFGIEVICLQSYTYMRLFPHNILGRYPTPIDGEQTTVDVYGERIDRVLYKIHVSLQFEFDLLCEQVSALDGLRGMDHRHGHW